MIAFDSLERRLTEAYRLQDNYYENALRILNQDAQALEHDGWAHDLQSALLQVALVEERMAVDKHAWEKAARSAGIELRSVLESVTTHIRALAAAIDRRSQEILARKQRLLPVLDEFIRHRRMLHSYESFGKSK